MFSGVADVSVYIVHGIFFVGRFALAARSAFCSTKPNPHVFGLGAFRKLVEGPRDKNKELQHAEGSRPSGASATGMTGQGAEAVDVGGLAGELQRSDRDDRRRAVDWGARAGFSAERKYRQAMDGLRKHNSRGAGLCGGRI